MNRFWSKVTPAPIQCCWEWTACKDRNSYGHFRLNNQRVLAHRVAYRLSKGEIPSDLIVRHTCDNPICCNPSHLILGTHADNTADMIKRQRCNPIKGEQQWKAKLTEKQVIEIYSSPLPQNELAKLYNISKRNVFYIKAKQRWKHIHN